MARSSDPVKWLERAAHIRGLGRGVRDRSIAPMFEKLAARLEELAIAKAEAELSAYERKRDQEAAPVGALQRRGISGGELNISTRSDEYDIEKSRRA